MRWAEGKGVCLEPRPLSWFANANTTLGRLHGDEDAHNLVATEMDNDDDIDFGGAHVLTNPVLRRNADGQGSETGAVRGIAVGNLDLDVVANAAAYDLFTVAPIRVGH